MPKLRPAKPDEVKRVLEKLGFTCVRQSGSHMIFHHSDGRWATLPKHKGRDLGKGILRKVLKDAKSLLMSLSNCAKDGTLSSSSRNLGTNRGLESSGHVPVGELSC